MFSRLIILFLLTIYSFGKYYKGFSYLKGKINPRSGLGLSLNHKVLPIEFEPFTESGSSPTALMWLSIFSIYKKEYPLFLIIFNDLF